MRVWRRGWRIETDHANDAGVAQLPPRSARHLCKTERIPMRFPKTITPFKTNRPRRNRQAIKEFVFNALNDQRDGDVFCVQVGANDGELSDPIFPMIQDFGWSALLIEPHPIYFSTLYHLHQNRDNVTAVNIGISDTPGEMPLFFLRQASQHLFPAHVRGCASLDRGWMQRAVARALDQTEQTDPDAHIDVVNVLLRRLDTVLAEQAVTRADLVVIDVEGHEASVLNSFDLSALNVSAALIECQRTPPDNAHNVVATLEKAGFVVFRVSIDLLALQPDPHQYI